jgi:spore maturation protein CgeB
MKIQIVDTYYPDFLKSWDFNPAATYQSELKRLLEFSFGTGDFYSRNLRSLGWDTEDVIINAPLQKPNKFGIPDVIFLQDLSIPTGRRHFDEYLLAGQCSCPMPPEKKLRKCNVIFTSFPHYVDRFERMGIRAVYNPLAFDPIVLDRINVELTQDMKRGPFAPDRIYDCVFIGGVGNPSHWKRGMETLETVAREIPTFKWWGYGYSTLPADSALRDKYQGEAWGLDMYRIMLQSKIVLNRHGEVAQGYMNNMRCFEATGCGALLLTEYAPNLRQFFKEDEAISYGSPEEAITKIRWYLDKDHEDVRAWVAANGQARTLRDHTYVQRMKTVSDMLQEMLCPI